MGSVASLKLQDTGSITVQLSGLKDSALSQLERRSQLWLRSDPWPGNSICLRAAKNRKKKEKKKKKKGHLQAQDHREMKYLSHEWNLSPRELHLLAKLWESAGECEWGRYVQPWPGSWLQICSNDRAGRRVMEKAHSTTESKGWGRLQNSKRVENRLLEQVVQLTAHQQHGRWWKSWTSRGIRSLDVI